jgi:hypothetical protein
LIRAGGAVLFRPNITAPLFPAALNNTLPIAFWSYKMKVGVKLYKLMVAVINNIKVSCRMCDDKMDTKKGTQNN